MSDETNQAGVGQSTYGPDFSGMGGRQSGGQSGDQSRRHPPRLAEQRRRRSAPRSPPMPPAPPDPTDAAHRRRARRRARAAVAARAVPAVPELRPRLRLQAAGERPAVPVAPARLAASPRWRCSPMRGHLEHELPTPTDLTDQKGNRR